MFKEPTTKLRNKHFKDMKGPMSAIKTKKLADVSLSDLVRDYNYLEVSLNGYHRNLNEVIDDTKEILEGRFPDNLVIINKEIETVRKANKRRYGKIHDRVSSCKNLVISHFKGGNSEEYSSMVSNLNTIILSQLKKETGLIAFNEDIKDLTSVFELRQCLDRLTVL